MLYMGYERCVQLGMVSSDHLCFMGVCVGVAVVLMGGSIGVVVFVECILLGIDCGCWCLI